MILQRKTILLSLCLSWLLTGCTAWHTPDLSNMPSRESLQSGEEITVSQNENVYAIARKHGVSMREIIVLNDLKPPFTLKPGQSLTLPLKESNLPKAPEAAPRGGIESTPLEPISKPVASAPLAQQNAVDTSPTALSPTPVAPKPLETTVTKHQQVASAETTEPTSSAKAPPANMTPFSAIPPVQGPIISSFGSKGQGLSNDGINIGAPKGSSVVAAAGGMVVYSGNEMKGFGNLILVRHEGGWVTAYAHLDRMLVSKDNVVAAGDQIGTVGVSGGVSAPQLHFETRYEGKPVDPQTVLKQME